MDHMKFETPDIVGGNIEKIGALFPSAVTEMRDEHGNVKKGINFEVLKQLLSRDVVDGDECYDFTWVGKKAAIAEAARPTTNTLRPVKEDSKDWDTTENLYIEGDNLEVLKILQESYLGKVKMIYIDPPYNTGHDFVYPDSFVMADKEYSAGSGYFDAEGNVNYARENSTSAGKYHSDWCSMMYSRLNLARNLLKDDGLIFISIDDNEVKNLKQLCDDIFGASNFVAQLIWQNKKGGGNDSTHIAIEHEYILVYAQNKPLLGEFYEKYSDDYIKRYKECDEIGRFYWDTFKRKAGKQYYPIVCPDGTVLEYDDDGNPISWLRSRARFESDQKIGDVRIIQNGGKWSVQFKQRIPLGKTPRSIFTTETVISDKGTTSTGASDVYEYFKKDVFSNPKPIELIQFMISFGMSKGDIILDFFSGSATTAEAVMRSNLDGEKYKYILVQIPENIDTMLKGSSNAKRVAENAVMVLDENKCPHTITELAKIRIRRAGEKIKSENPLGAKDLDTGFRVFRVDSSNMKDVYYHPEELDQMSLSDMVSNIKDDRTDMDLLYSCLLDWGVEINLPHTSTEIDGCTVHNVDNGALIACFDANVPASVIRYMAQQQPLRAVFRDSAFTADDAKINVTETFKNFSPDTSVKVI